MSRDYKPIPPYVKDFVALSDETPSGLVWIKPTKRRKPGAPVTRRMNAAPFYVVSIHSVVYMAHRIVYYLRTGEDPGRGDVIHGPDNPECDNRKKLSLSFAYAKKRKTRSTGIKALNSALNFYDQDSMEEFLGQLVLLDGSASNSVMLSKLGWTQEFYEQVKEALVARFFICLKPGPGGAVMLANRSIDLSPSPEFLRQIGSQFFK